MAKFFDGEFTKLSIEFRDSEKKTLGLFTRETIQEDEKIIDLEIGDVGHERNFRTVDIGDGLHVDHPYLRYCNHSCYPTAYVDKKYKVLRAERLISANQEITFDYMYSEEDIASPFKCNCGYDNCVGIVKKTCIPKGQNL